MVRGSRAYVGAPSADKAEIKTLKKACQHDFSLHLGERCADAVAWATAERQIGISCSLVGALRCEALWVKGVGRWPKALIAMGQVDRVEHAGTRRNVKPPKGNITSGHP